MKITAQNDKRYKQTQPIKEAWMDKCEEDAGGLQLWFLKTC